MTTTGYQPVLSARALAPTTETLHDFMGRRCPGLPMFAPAGT
jgi:hypothetical protein